MSKVTYIALVEKSSDGWYAITFPDLPGAHAQAQTLEDAAPEAKAALESFLYAASLVNEPVSPPSEAIASAPGQMHVIVTADMDAYKRMQDTKPVKKTVSLPTWMANGADRAGLSLSKVLQDSLRSRLNAQ